MKRPRSTENDDSLNKPKPKKGSNKAETEEAIEIESQAQASKKWTPEQRLQLIEAVLKRVKVPWDEVCNEVDGGKNGKMCYDQWRRKIVPGLKNFIKSGHEH